MARALTELALHVTDPVLKGAALPVVGTPLMAVIRLIGWIWISQYQGGRAAGDLA